MESFKKIISLNQASKFSGYSQDYLGYLIRKGEIHGVKKGRSWFTTEEEVNNYLFKKKIRHKEFAIKDFFSPNRIKKIILITIIIFIGGFFLLQFINKDKVIVTQEIHSGVTSDGDPIKLN